MQLLKFRPSERVDDQAERIARLDQELSAERQQRFSAEQVLDSINRSQAVIEFQPDGTILRANDNFLKTVGYSAGEIVGKHHRMFVDNAYAESAEYKRFWEELRSGKFKNAEFKRFGKGHREIWIQATYNPVFDGDGNVIRIVKFASDITQGKQVEKEIRDRSLAVIEFLPTGIIVDANDRFLRTVGYSLDQIRGSHHSMFMPNGEAEKPEYREFWSSLSRGVFKQGEFQRVNSSGQTIWLRGAYSPRFGVDGSVVGVIKSVSDITDEVNSRRKSRDAGESVANGVREISHAIFEITGRINQTATLAQDSEAMSSRASDEVKDLVESSRSIGKVVDVIQDLADQTNLLALNATIEAARAGESGRGFSVVANEVKTLATQTGVATSNIRDIVKSLEQNMAIVVKSIDKIGESIAEVNNNTGQVAVSIDEQSRTMSILKSSADVLLGIK